MTTFIRSFVVGLLSLSVIVIGTATPSLAAPKFGTTPYTDTRNAASAALPSGLTVDKFTAMILAPTWPEIGDNNVDRSPDPAAMGRSDRRPEQYSGYASRAFFHSGHGMWQLDITGLGMGLNLEQMVGTNTASAAAAAAIKGLWTDANAIWNNQTDPSGALRREYAWAPWRACFRGGQNCEQIYTSLTSTSPLNISLENKVGRFSGGAQGTCYMPGTPSGWACFMYDASLSQADPAFWNTAIPLEGNSSISPLMKRAYTWTSGGNDIRYWNASDLGLSYSALATRAFGNQTPAWSTSSSKVCFNNPICK